MHHALILEIPRTEIGVPAGSWPETLVGAHYRHEFVKGFSTTEPPRERYAAVPPLPAIDDEYFDWIALLESVAEARGRFVFVELGAGYGRWLVRAMMLAKGRGLDAVGLGVEAEPEHFRFLQQHCADNGVDVRLLHAAVDGQDGEVPFATGNASAWYGQSIARKGRKDDAPIITVPAITIATVVGTEPRVDLMHMDLQKAEGIVIPAAIELLSARVKRVCVGIHGKMGPVVRDAFCAAGWRCLADYPRKTTSETPYGPIAFGDGVQIWKNPRL